MRGQVGPVCNRFVDLCIYTHKHTPFNKSGDGRGGLPPGAQRHAGAEPGAARAADAGVFWGLHLYTHAHARVCGRLAPIPIYPRHTHPRPTPQQEAEGELTALAAEWQEQVPALERRVQELMARLDSSSTAAATSSTGPGEEDAAVAVAGEGGGGEGAKAGAGAATAGGRGVEEAKKDGAAGAGAGVGPAPPPPQAAPPAPAEGK